MTLPRVGLFLGYSPWFSLREQVQLAQLADDRGLDSVWVAEAYGYDAVAIAAVLASRTERVAVGTAVMQMPARRARATAMAAASLDAISGGRFRLGLGQSGPQVSEGWYGVPFGEGITRTRAYVGQVRSALAGEAVPVPLEPGPATGLGKPIRLLVDPPGSRVPIYLGSLSPAGIRLCADIADGWVPIVVDKRMLSDFSPPGRPFDVAAVVPVSIAPTVEQARDDVREWLTFYFGAMGHPRRHFLVDAAARYGHGESAREVQARFLAGDRKGAAEALTDELIDAASIATTPQLLRQHLREYAEAGATSVLAIPCGDRRATIVALAEGSAT